jgi:hypothetical protein
MHVWRRATMQIESVLSGEWLVLSDESLKATPTLALPLK